MAYESFYGGRRGISIQIVKRFDGLDIPGEAYKRKCYAYKKFDGDENKYFIYPFIERTYENFHNKQYHWDAVDLDGGDVLTVFLESTSPEEAVIRSLGDPVHAEGMVQCFSQGGASTDVVNYGEYVLIDTVTDRNEYNNPDNGKIYRRGMNYIVTPDNPLAGAEYIGSIVGPQGNITKLRVDGYNEVKEHENAETSEYFMGNGLVPGKVDDTTFNDKIKAAYVAIKDAQGNIEECLCAFEFPFLVQEYIARSISPYGKDGRPLPADYELATRLDDEQHPFYEKWQINVPKGIRGDGLCKWKVEPTMSRPRAEFWLKEEDMETELPDGNLLNSYPITNITSNSLTVQAPDMTVYIKPHDGWKYKFKYTIVNYENNILGDEHEIIDNTSVYDVINKIDLQPNGVITAYYTNRDYETSENQIKWIEQMYINTNGSAEEEGQGDQKLHVIYNTDVTEDLPLGYPINYIIDSVVTEVNDTKNPNKVPSYHMLAYYSDPAKRTSSISYYSEKLGKMVTGWTDLGYVRGPVEGLRIIGEVTDIEDLYDESTQTWTKPEEILDDPELGARMEGWAVTDSLHTIWVYDYKVGNKWYSIGSLDSSSTDVSKLICVDAADGAEPADLARHAVWAAYTTIKYVE